MVLGAFQCYCPSQLVDLFFVCHNSEAVAAIGYWLQFRVRDCVCVCVCCSLDMVEIATVTFIVVLTVIGVFFVTPFNESVI